MFNFQAWITTFRDHLRTTGETYNDADSYGVTIEREPNRLWRVLGIHHLLPHENNGNHNVFIEVLCKQNERDGFRAIHWTWEGRRPDEIAQPVFAGQKPLNELVDLPLNLGMIVSIWTQGGEIANGFSSNHPDEAPGNTIGHHSFFVCFQEMDEDEPVPEPPLPEPEPKERVMLIKKSWLDSQPVDSDGFIVIED
jgi:hypothetical protein